MGWHAGSRAFHGVYHHARSSSNISSGDSSSSSSSPGGSYRPRDGANAAATAAAAATAIAIAAPELNDNIPAVAHPGAIAPPVRVQHVSPKCTFSYQKLRVSYNNGLLVPGSCCSITYVASILFFLVLPRPTPRPPRGVHCFSFILPDKKAKKMSLS